MSDSEQNLKEALSERDASKTALLEMEIAHHEQIANSGSDKEKSRLDLAKITTEKETLEVTLELKDKELKARKDEHRLEVSRLQLAKDECQRDVQAKAAK